MATAKKPPETKKRGPGGRPTKYTDQTAAQAAKLCALGATDAELANFFEVAVSTISLWKVQHPEFSEALNPAKDVSDDRVQRSLYQRAMGYEHDEIDIRVVGTKLVKTPIRKHYPPDVTACIFWLKNRRPQQWRTDPDPNGGEGKPQPVRVPVEIVDASVPDA